MTTRGRPRKPITGDTDIHVAVMLPPFIVEHIDSEGEPRGAYVARLALERMLQMTSDKKLIGKICDAIYK